MRAYNTKQRKTLLDFFESRADKTVSACEVAENLRDSGISRSAVYRNLAALEKDGKIRRVVKVGERVAYYQYAAHEHCKNKIHISCMKCGKTKHISSEMANIIAKNIILEDEFVIDKEETVLYGICKDCRAS